jgi:hypothetical protein
VPLIPYGTSLPPNPADGTEAILVDSVTNPSYQWRLRYNAESTSAYKWEFIGGTPFRSYVTPQETTTNTGFVPLTTAGPQLTAPNAGEYKVMLENFSYNLTAGNGAQMALFVNAVNSGVVLYGGANYYNHVYKSAPLTVSTVGYSLVCLYAAEGGGTATFGERALSITPNRVA